MVPLAVVFVATSLSGGTASAPAVMSVAQSSVQLAAAEMPAATPAADKYVEVSDVIPTAKAAIVLPIFAVSAGLAIGTFVWMGTSSDRRHAIEDFETAKGGFAVNICTTNGPDCQEVRVRLDAFKRAETAWKLWGASAAFTAGVGIVIAAVWPNKPGQRPSAVTAQVTPTLGGLQLEGTF
jgi:hypothetical protein